MDKKTFHEIEANIAMIEQEVDELNDALIEAALVLYDEIEIFNEHRRKINALKSGGLKKSFYKLTGKYGTTEAQLQRQFFKEKQRYDNSRKPMQELQEKIKEAKANLANEHTELRRLKESPNFDVSVLTKSADDTTNGADTPPVKEDMYQKATELLAKEKQLTELIDSKKRVGNIMAEIVQKMEDVNQYIDKEKAVKLSKSQGLTVNAKRKTLFEIVFDKRDMIKNIDDIYLFMSDTAANLKSVITKTIDINKNQSALAPIPKIGDNGITVHFIEYFYSIICGDLSEKQSLSDDINTVNDINEKLGKIINEEANIRAKVADELKKTGR